MAIRVRTDRDGAKRYGGAEAAEAGKPSLRAVLLTARSAAEAPRSTALAAFWTPRLTAPSTLTAIAEAWLAAELATSAGPAVTTAVNAARQAPIAKLRQHLDSDIADSISR